MNFNEIMNRETRVNEKLSNTLEATITKETHLQPRLLGSPVDVVLRFGDVDASTTKAEHRQTHRLERAVAGVNHEVCLKNFFRENSEKDASQHRNVCEKNKEELTHVIFCPYFFFKGHSRRRAFK